MSGDFWGSQEGCQGDRGVSGAFWGAQEGCQGPFRPSVQTTQGNRLSCRDQEGRRGSEEAVPGPSVFPSGEPGVSLNKRL